jgi:hypothetical protein
MSVRKQIPFKSGTFFITFILKFLSLSGQKSHEISHIMQMKDINFDVK